MAILNKIFVYYRTMVSVCKISANAASLVLYDAYRPTSCTKLCPARIGSSLQLLDAIPAERGELRHVCGGSQHLLEGSRRFCKSISTLVKEWIQKICLTPRGSIQIGGPG